MKKQLRSGTLGEFWNSLMACACVALVLSGVFFFGPRHKDRAVAAMTNEPLVASNSLASIKRVSVPWYFRSGQLEADMRSIAALLRYLTDTEKIAQTNPIPTKAATA
jgi:hypothetical protein